MVEREPALDHSRRLKAKGGEQEQIVDLVVLAKSFSPKENRINHAQAVNTNSEQKEVSIGQPSHHDSLIFSNAGARRIPAAGSAGERQSCLHLLLVRFPLKTPASLK